MNSPGSLFAFALGGIMLGVAALLAVGLFTTVEPDQVAFAAVVMVVSAIGGTALIILGVSVRSRARQRDHAHPRWTEEVGGFTPGQTQGGIINDVEYRFLYEPPKKKGKETIPSFLTVEVPFESAEEFEVVRESWFDRLGKRLRLAVEVQTGSPEFDAAVYLRTDDPSYVDALFADPAKRGAILSLLNSGFSSVKLENRALVARWEGFHPSQAPDSALFVPDAAEKLFFVRDKPPADRPEALRGGSRRAVTLVALWTVVVVLFLSLLSFFFYTPMRFWDIFLKSLTYSVPGFVVFMFAAGLLLRGNSRSHYQWAKLFCWSTFAFLFGGIGATNFANGEFDRSPEAPRLETVVNKTTSRSKNKTTYTVHFPSKSRPGSTDSVTVSSGDWDRVVVNRTQVELVTIPGALGVEILRRKRLVF